MNARLGDLLVRTGKITQEQNAAAHAAHKNSSSTFGSCLVQSGILTEDQLAQALSEQFGVSIIELSNVTIDDSILKLLPQEIARKHYVMPIENSSSTITVAMSDPSNMVALNDLKFLTGLDIKIVVAKESDLKNSYEKFYEKKEPVKVEIQKSESIIENAQSVPSLDIEVEPKELEFQENAVYEETVNDIVKPPDEPINKLIAAIFTEALRRDSSQIHIESSRFHLTVRVRINGVLEKILTLPICLQTPIISNLLKIARETSNNNENPSSGFIHVNLKSTEEVTFAFSILNTIYGKKIVLDRFNTSLINRTIKMLASNEVNTEIITSAIHKKNGIILITGPSHSGKITTAYTLLSQLINSGRSIYSIEKNIKYEFDEISQILLSEKNNFRLYEAISIVAAQSPDIVLVSEIDSAESMQEILKLSQKDTLIILTIASSSISEVFLKLSKFESASTKITDSLICTIFQKLSYDNNKTKVSLEVQKN